LRSEYWDWLELKIFFRFLAKLAGCFENSEVLEIDEVNECVVKIKEGKGWFT
jgi:hypothetical protein